jgi:hypothetical protein
VAADEDWAAVVDQMPILEAEAAFEAWRARFDPHRLLSDEDIRMDVMCGRHESDAPGPLSGSDLGYGQTAGHL